MRLGTDLDLPGMVEDNQTQQDDCGEADEAFECKRVQGLLCREREQTAGQCGVWGQPPNSYTWALHSEGDAPVIPLAWADSKMGPGLLEFGRPGRMQAENFIVSEACPPKGPACCVCKVSPHVSAAQLMG